VTAPALSGFHHLKVPVADLDVGLAWYQTVLGAQHLTGLDHIDGDGTRYASILEIPGLPVLVELRWAPGAARALRQCDLMVLALDTDAQFDDWITHLDANGVEHSPILPGDGGPVMVIVEPDGKFIRLMKQPPGGLASQTMPDTPLDPHGPWLDAIPMRHPRPTDDHHDQDDHE
jgi:catechol 2,3-dioxygenase-like lactoylglutathione lyase family enzyme